MQNHKRYIGHSENVLERLGKHVSTLNDGTHDCLLLQGDWDRVQEKHTTFRLSALSVGQNWMEKRKREEEEARLIEGSDKERLYNQLHRGRYINSDVKIIVSLSPPTGKHIPLSRRVRKS